MGDLTPAEDVELRDERPRGERAEDGDLPPPRRRPRPGSSSSFGSFLSGFLGSVTKTASVDDCPGKCIHALASLMCDQVLENIQCPANMRCCVERSSKPKPPPRENVNPLDSLLELELPPKPEDKNADDEDEEENAEEEEQIEEEVTEEKKEKKKRRKKKKTTTEATTTTTTETTTTTKEVEMNKKKSSNSSLSRFYSNSPLSLVIVSLLTFLQTFKNP